MILSRAKPAIGGDKAEEKGGSAGRKQVVPDIILELVLHFLPCVLFLVGHVSVCLIPREKYHLLI